MIVLTLIDHFLLDNGHATRLRFSGKDIFGDLSRYVSDDSEAR